MAETSAGSDQCVQSRAIEIEIEIYFHIQAHASMQAYTLWPIINEPLFTLHFTKNIRSFQFTEHYQQVGLDATP